MNKIRYNIYIPSKGRYEKSYTADLLIENNINFKIYEMLIVFFEEKKGCNFKLAKLFSLKIQFQDFLRYAYRYLIKTLKIRLYFIDYLMIVLNDVNSFKKAIKSIC